MTYTDKLQDLLKYFIQLEYTPNRKQQDELAQKYGNDWGALLLELKKRRLIKNADEGGFFVATDEGREFYKEGGPVGEENRKKEKLDIEATKSVIEAVNIAKEANSISLQSNEIANNSNKIASEANKLSLLAFWVSVGGFVTAIISIVIVIISHK
jgi:hypothetical protein